MASAAKSEGIFINLDLGEIRDSIAAREKMKAQASAQSGNEGNNPSSNRAPNFIQSYTGKGMLLDIRV